MYESFVEENPACFKQTFFSHTSYICLFSYSPKVLDRISFFSVQKLTPAFKSTSRFQADKKNGRLKNFVGFIKIKF